VRGGLVAAVVALALIVTACGGSPDTRVTEPAVVTHRAGTDVYRIILTTEAAERLDVKTVVVARRGGETAVPYSAVFYSATGDAWAYVKARPLTFERRAIVVDRIDGDRAILSSGPAPGTPVVSIGVSELHGIESGAGATP
jgi:hypothetical protein